MLAICILILLSLLQQVKSAVDLTLQPEANGTLVVQACLAKIAYSAVRKMNENFRASLQESGITDFTISTSIVQDIMSKIFCLLK